ncbi:hypothetical protein [Leucobacter sp. OH1287]|uniref:hypothetical protein n=1 Tax=Leucobacter sp. OH1287 TaxID=2491049 RepID=UPI000F5D5F2B|nr:hypothetical protein [Leucobacter sp. OH1287]RRD61369.1 hypothetical protein EII30_02935 [Leucobacter sp. OH1287]
MSVQLKSKAGTLVIVSDALAEVLKKQGWKSTSASKKSTPLSDAAAEAVDEEDLSQHMDEVSTEDIPASKAKQ